ncbi:MAG: thiamine-phosphate kinase [Candidatus Omnitrophota bacterium]
MIQKKTIIRTTDGADFASAKSGLNEIGFINFIKKNAVLGKDVILGIGDDAAVVRTKGKFLVCTTDIIIQGVHFKKGDNLRKIGRKALAVNISDIAAMGALPKYALISAGIPRGYTLSQAKEIFIGINNLARKFGISVIGGDTSASEILVINAAVIGEADKDKLVRRSTAKPGDFICLTGTLSCFPGMRHFDFTPRVYEAGYLVKNYPITSMIDISDGLVIDLYRICETSKCGAVLFTEFIPRAKKMSLTDALYNSGESFELLFTVSEKYAGQLKENFFRRFKTKFSIIGKICPRHMGIKLLDKNGKLTPAEIKGYLHFKR